MGANKFEASGLQIQPLALQMGQPGAISNFGLQAAAAPTPTPEVSTPSPAITRSFGA